MSHFLEVHGLVSGYGKNTVLQGLDLHVDRGESVCLLGRNGVGKTTAINTLFGFVSPSAGRVSLDDQDITGWQSDRIARSGVAVVPQGRRLFRQLSVYDNLRIAERENEDAWSVEDCMDRFPILRTRAAVPAGALSGGEQQIVALARALVTGPRLLLLDEPSEGLAPRVLDTILEILRLVKASGRSILIVEQNLYLGLGIADRVYVMNKGCIVAEEDPVVLRNDEDRLHRLMGVSAEIEREGVIHE